MRIFEAWKKHDIKRIKSLTQIIVDEISFSFENFVQLGNFLRIFYPIAVD